MNNFILKSSSDGQNIYDVVLKGEKYNLVISNNKIVSFDKKITPNTAQSSVKNIEFGA